MSMRDVVQNPEKVKKFAYAAFEAIDTNRSGYLEREELEAVMCNDLNPGEKKPSREDIDEVLRELDVNNDGRVSLSEFQVLIEQLLRAMAQDEEQS